MFLRLDYFPLYLLPVSLLLCIFVSAKHPYPEVSCSDTFKYDYDPKYGGHYGLIRVQKGASTTSELQVNMSANAQQHIYSNLQIKTLSKTEEFFKKSGLLKYAVLFPTQKTIPKLIWLKFNGRVLCSGTPDSLTPGIVQTHMWAKATVTTYGPVQSTQLQKPLEIFTVAYVPIEATSQIDKQPATVSYQFGIPFTSVASSNFPYQCGTAEASPQSGAFNGQGIPFGELPWLAAIMYKRNANYKLHCTGNLISDKHVITAGHCVENVTTKSSTNPENDFIVVLGNLNISSGSSVRRSRTVITNSKPDKVDSNVAIIVLQEPTGIVLGWDARQGDRTPKKIEFPIVSQERCLGSNKISDARPSAGTFCAGSYDNTSKSLADDSGAGLMIRDDSTGKWFLRGLSGSIRHSDLARYVTFTDVAKIRLWIEDEMEKY
ncbi:hypothetical protein Trydic_g4963 [Trypoxylus dichotomus]